jgi:hypothetical protein
MNTMQFCLEVNLQVACNGNCHQVYVPVRVVYKFLVWLLSDYNAYITSCVHVSILQQHSLTTYDALKVILRHLQT